MTTGAIHSWDTATAVDGPGTRFVVFTSGCPLRCRYCQNPETWHERDGRRVSVDELIAEIAKYRRFIEVAGGGVTISGGEPLLQHEFVAELLHRVKELGMHKALDTSGFLGGKATEALLDDTDLGKPMWIRFVLVPGSTDDWDNVEGVAEFIATLDSVECVDVLPFHKLGAPKYARLGIPFPLADAPTPDAALVDRVRGQFIRHGLRA